MIQTDQRPTTTASVPVRPGPVVWWLVGVSLGVVLASPVPWEQWCSGGVDGFPNLCFHASLWSGSAQLFGMIALVLAATFAVAAVRRGWARDRRLPTGGLVLVVACLATLAVKVSMVFVDDRQTRAVQGGISTLAAGQWLGLALLVVGFCCLLGAASQRPSWRRAVLTITTSLVVGGVAVPYAWSGLAWWGGPLASPADLGGGNWSGVTVAPGKPAFLQNLLFIRSGGHLAGTMDGVALIGATPTFPITGSYVITGCVAGTITTSNLQRCTAPLAGWVEQPTGERAAPLLIVGFRVPRPGVYRSGWFRIDYRVGPFHFQIFRTDGLTVCAPQPGHRKCPGAGF